MSSPCWTENGDQVVDVQRGTVTAVTNQSITVQSEDGFSGTYAIDPQTKVRKDRQSATIDQVAINDPVVVFAVKDGASPRMVKSGPPPL